ncbi:hypothetical protein ABE42_32585 [Bacillus thuringiensis]|uniref:Putative lipoprotein n=1 Tax=Bacillus cereus (strain 03BB102) TaxID=572264 RepID=A0A158RK39_BACC3|nr:MULTISPECIES: hypothetical protein [Bacillus cereus group]MBG9583808.1 hypothetical protein [Bacillus thuringiensis]ACO27447.1 putative lipoprotein [Bacillus cereus 03BB102]AJG54846.1 putative lipoprotein [Bacillus cereus 03BB102]AJG61091.1 putative lipoprotein [Bacillus cereus D17]MCU5058551.1 hypothetical protein [Bacillus cereus]
MKKCDIRLFIILTLILLGGCTIDQKNEEQQIVEKANETAIQYFKEKENLDVVITGYEFAPSDFQTVFIDGHVKGDKSKTFGVGVEYGGGEYNISSRSYSKNLKLKE